MKNFLFGLSVLAFAAATTASGAAAAKGSVNCVSFSPAGYCDAMEYDSKKSATWHNYDCGGSMGKQTKANYKKGTTVCDGTKGCNPAAAYGWDSLNWTFDFTANTGTLIGTSGGTQYTLQSGMPISVTPGACSVNRTRGGVSALSH